MNITQTKIKPLTSRIQIFATLFGIVLLVGGCFGDDVVFRTPESLVSATKAYEGREFVENIKLIEADDSWAELTLRFRIVSYEYANSQELYVAGKYLDRIEGEIDKKLCSFLSDSAEGNLIPERQRPLDVDYDIESRSGRVVRRTNLWGKC